MLYVKVKGYYAYQHKDNRIETIEPGSVIGMKDEDARAMVLHGMGEEVDGPENLVRAGKSHAEPVEHPGTDPKAAHADRATSGPQRR